ncbi:MAG: DoxX family protein [Chitinophagales bacterium]
MPTSTIPILLLLLSILFLWSSINKLTGNMTDRFLTWGYPEWFAPILGVFEIIAVFMLWTTGSQFLALVFLSLLMFAAIGTLYMNGELIHRYILPFVTLFLLFTLIYLSNF